MPSCGTSPIEAMAAITPVTATHRPGRPWPGDWVSKAVRITLPKEFGSFGGSGTSTYFLRPIQKIKVAMNIRMPGMPKAQAGP